MKRFHRTRRTSTIAIFSEPAIYFVEDKFDVSRGIGFNIAISVSEWKSYNLHWTVLKSRFIRDEHINFV